MQPRKAGSHCAPMGVPMATPKQTEQDPIFQIKVSLLHVKPAVWRRLLVRADTSLAELHFILNEAMGWSCSHLHSFTDGERTFVDPELQEEEAPELDHEDERPIELSSLVEANEKLQYTYDFGDDWRHEILIEKRLPLDPRYGYPLCIGGERACPPEDCGGPPGYEHLLHVLAKPGDPEHDELITWLGGYFEPASFDANRTNAAINEMYEHADCECGHDHGDEEGDHDGNCSHHHEHAGCCKHGNEGTCDCDKNTCDCKEGDCKCEKKNGHVH